jgi:type IV pilus assembly protein PilM
MSSGGYIGVDIGTSSVKMVELAKSGNKLELVTYGYSENAHEGAMDGWTKNTEYVVKVVDNIYKKMEASTNKAIATLPAFSVFSSIINLRNVDKKTMASAVEWEAKKFIPLPLEEMILDWKPIFSGKNPEKDGQMVFLTGSPKKLVKKYVDIFRKTMVNLVSLETETFSLIRSLLGDDKSTVMIVEMGASNTDICIVKESIPMVSRSLDLGGKTITRAISSTLGIGHFRADQFKRDLGFASSQGSESVIPKTISNSVNPVIDEIRYLLNLFQNKNNEKVEKIILSGGSVLLPGFVDYLKEKLGMTIVIGDPWARVSYPPELKPILNEIGPGFAVAIGSAMREMN